NWLHTGSGGEVVAIHVRDMSRSGTLTVDLDLHRDVFDGPQRQYLAKTFCQMVESYADNAGGAITGPDLLQAPPLDQPGGSRQEIVFDFGQ
ncbi:MAG TPA: hypothetical protein VI756_06635, partial [Blastocatellia bacterium]